MAKTPAMSKRKCRCCLCGQRIYRKGNFCYGCRRYVCPNCVMMGGHRSGGRHLYDEYRKR